MTRMTGPDCVVMCNLINTHTHTHTHTYTHTHTQYSSGPPEMQVLFKENRYTNVLDLVFTTQLPHAYRYNCGIRIRCPGDGSIETEMNGLI